MAESWGGRGRIPRGGLGKQEESNQSDGVGRKSKGSGLRGERGALERYTGRAEFKALLHSLRQSFLMKQQRLDAPVFEFWYLVTDDLCQHLREFHTEGFIHKCVETDLE